MRFKQILDDLDLAAGCFEEMGVVSFLHFFEAQKYKQFSLCSIYVYLNLQSYIIRVVMTSAFTCVLVLLFVWQIHPARVLTKVLLDDPDALCLDGSPGAYYVGEGSPTKFLLNFEGGGWCGSHLGVAESIQTCFQRSQHFLGSSTLDPTTLGYTQGIFSDHPENIFREWTVVHMRYCDGAGHQGYRKEPIEYNGSKLYFRGHNITKAQLSSLDKNYKLLSEASEIVVTGQSAGGLATFMWSNYVGSRAPKTAKVWAIPDSGIFLNSENYPYHKQDYKIKFFNLMEISNKEVDPPTEECVLANSVEKWRCMFAEYLYQHIKVPLFAANSLYDSWSLSYLLLMQCNQQSSLMLCQPQKLKYIQDYKHNTSLLIQKIGSRGTNGAWAPACSNHVYTLSDFLYSLNFRIPANSKNSVAFALQSWMSGTSGNHLHMDGVSWPDNAPCAGQRTRWLTMS